MKQIGPFKYWLQAKGGFWTWTGVINNAHKFTFKEEAAKLAIDRMSKKAETSIEKV